MSDEKDGQNPLDEILNDKNRKKDDTANESGGLLARWWRTILYDSKITESKFTSLLKTYLMVRDPNNNKVAANNNLGSYHKKLAQGDMTWKTFIEALKILNIFRIDISIKLHWSNGRKTTHNFSAILATEEYRRKYNAYWNKFHGVQPIDAEYLKTLKNQEINGKGEYFDEYQYKLKRNKQFRNKESEEGDTNE